MFDPIARPAPTLKIDALRKLDLTDENKACITRLMSHLEDERKTGSKTYNAALSPVTKLAGVLVLLYEEAGRLRVLLTTRSKTLRTHAGQTALPGGRTDTTDTNFVFTALREAREEVALPTDSPDIHVLGCLHPFLSLHKLLVVPVVALLTRPALLRRLKMSEKEVAHIFSHPLEALLDPPLASTTEKLVPIGCDDWPYETEYYNTSDSVVPMLGGTSYRMNRFRTSASPVKGLTADILMQTAEVAYARSTVFPRYAPDQLRTVQAILSAVGEFESRTASKPVNGYSHNFAH